MTLLQAIAGLRRFIAPILAVAMLHGVCAGQHAATAAKASPVAAIEEGVAAPCHAGQDITPSSERCLNFCNTAVMSDVGSAKAVTNARSFVRMDWHVDAEIDAQLFSPARIALPPRLSAGPPPLVPLAVNRRLLI